LGWEWRGEGREERLKSGKPTNRHVLLEGESGAGRTSKIGVAIHNHTAPRLKFGEGGRA